MISGNKSRLLSLYHILRDQSDVDTPLSTTQLLKILASECNIVSNRVTVGNDLKVLCENDMNIHCIKSSQNKFFYDQQLFEISEIKMLVDAISSAKFISQPKSEKLIGKLLSLVNQKEHAILRRHIYSSQRVKTEYSAGYYNVDSINTAIDSGHKVSFQYFDYDVKKNQVLKHDGKEYVLSPYSLIWDGDYYYVIGCDDNLILKSFRLDRIVPCPEILDEIAIPCPADFNLAEYSRSVFRMYSTEVPVKVSLQCEQHVMKALIDNFGINVDTLPMDENRFIANITVCTSPTFFRWVFGWNGAVKIISPDSAVNEFRQMIQNNME